ncbi:MAG: hypothetical protein KDE22_01685 [Rhodobacterales bacterium]|nr:hypothetical protein [Rhodobacterales bacterium]
MDGFLTFDPLIPWPFIAAGAAVGLALSAYALARRGRGALLRLGVLLVLVGALANPIAVRESGEVQPDVAVILVDDSASQNVGDRRRQTAEALAQLQDQMARLPDLETRVVRVPEDPEGGTRLLSALGEALSDVPGGRFAGAVLITDGQSHDPPEQAALPDGPVHVLLTGAPGEFDRRLVVDSAPAYGIVDQPVTITFRVDGDADGPAQGAPVRVILNLDGRQAAETLVAPGAEGAFTFPLDHAGQTVAELVADAAPGELSTANNRAMARINGVRDRLRVLLVSGQPHPGERMWRNLLKADPAVDLVHFTILRPPEKGDFTPLKELSLIVFPIKELFDEKLHDFDLIVFDRYMVRDVLPPSYLRNIADYVDQGGALMMAVGPEFAGLRSLYNTPLGRVMPGQPTGQVSEGPFRPRVTDLGRRHPVAAGLPLDGEPGPRWGRWYRQVDLVPAVRGETLMDGPGSRPLLLLERVGEGRVAQLLSDHIWLWARGHDGGGPQGELLRRLAHWLMKEPDLEEERLSATVDGGRLLVERRSLSETLPPITVTAPDGTKTTLTLTAGDEGIARADMAVAGDGLYRVEDGQRLALAAAGALNPPELADLRATPERLAPVAEASGGAVSWLRDGLPAPRRVKPNRTSHGRDWLGLVRHESLLVTGVTQEPLLPGLALALLALAALMLAWWREGR